jgi:hypothetical protein
MALTAKAVSTTQINISWTQVAGATGYVVEELIAGVWEPIQKLVGSNLAFSVPELSPGATYVFKVGATDLAGTVFSNSQSATTL